MPSLWNGYSPNAILQALEAAEDLFLRQKGQIVVTTPDSCTSFVNDGSDGNFKGTLSFHSKQQLPEILHHFDVAVLQFDFSLFKIRQFVVVQEWTCLFDLVW